MKNKTDTAPALRCEAMVRRFSREEKANIAHAIDHLRANKICENLGHSGWYSGNREQFEKRHIKAIAFMQSLLSPNDPDQQRRAPGTNS